MLKEVIDKMLSGVEMGDDVFLLSTADQGQAQVQDQGQAHVIVHSKPKSKDSDLLNIEQEMSESFGHKI